MLPITRPPRYLSCALLGALAVLLAIALAAPASASADDDRVRSLEIRYEIAESGEVHVTETYRWDFGSRQGRGFARELDAVFRYDDDHYREYAYASFTASSPTGAPTDIDVIDDGARLEVQVAAPEDSDERVTGVQTYVLDYTITGALNAVRGQSGVPDADEFYWNAQGPDHQPTDRVEVTVVGPVDATAVRCTQDSDGTACTSVSAPGSEVVATAENLDDGDPLTIAVAYPPGTFTNTDPILVDAGAWEDEHGALDSDVNVGAILAVVGGAIAVIAGGVTTSVVATRRRRRDLAYVGIPPGTFPPAGAHVPEEQLTSEPPVAVRFSPPDDLSVAEVGALWSRTLRTRDATATMIDLAVRGYLHVTEVPRKKPGKPAKDWTLTRTTKPEAGLLPHEQGLLDALFATGASVTMSSLEEKFADKLKKVLGQVGDEVGKRGLVNQRLGHEGASVASFKQRTARGRAYYEQIRGFELYLTTAEADQLRFEEGQDLFSRYLPYAIVFGTADRWAKIFAELEARGVALQQPLWYSGYYGAFSYHAFGSSFDRLATTASTAISSTPGSSGGSGFSGSGSSFSGGGGGGGGSRGL